MTLDTESGTDDSTLDSGRIDNKNYGLKVETLENVRSRTYDVVRDAMQSDGATLVDAMPAAGKSHNTFDVARDTGLPISYLTEREDLYKEAARRCHKRDLECKTLPSPHRKCPTFMGEHGEELKREVRQLYQRGLSGGEIHAEKELPCSPDCPYSRAWDFEPEDYDVLIGHYSHANVPRVVENRVVVVDEFPGDSAAHEFSDEKNKPSPEPLVTHFLQQRDGIPFDSWGEITEERDSEDGQEAVSWFQNNPRDLSTEEVIEANSGDSHALAGRLVIALLTMTDLDNRFEVSMSNNGVCVRSLESNKMWLLDPPELNEAESVIGLDGTPCSRMWDTALGEEFDVRKVVPDDKKDHYVHEILNLSLYEPEFAGDGGMKPYHNDEWITPDKDESKLFGLELEFGEEPALISTATAVGGQSKTGLYETEGVVDQAGLTKNYASIHSSNEFTEYDVGMVSGCPRPSDDVIKRWVAMMGLPAEREGKGNDVEFTNEHGNDVFQHYVHDEVLQAILRFSREGDGAHVLVNTTATPDWLTTGDVDLPTTSPSERRIIDTLKVADEPLTQDTICNTSGVSIQRVSEILGEFKREDLVEMQDNPGPKPSLYEWCGKD